MGGYAASFNEVNDQTKTDLTKAELIAFPILALLLLLVFRGVVAAGIPLLIGGISIVGTLFVLRVMSLFVDTSIFALNIATALSLGLAVDYALLMVSRYREEIERDGATREAHRRTVVTAGRTAFFSGITVARGAGGAGDHAAALPLLDGGRRSLGRPALGDRRDPRRPLDAGAAGNEDRCPLDPPRRVGLGRVRRLVPARPRRDAASGRRRPRQLGLPAGRRRAADLDDPDRPQLRLRPPQQARLRSQQLRRSALPPGRHRGGDGGRRRAARARRSWRRSTNGSWRSPGSSAAPPSSRPRADVAYANFALAEPATSSGAQTRSRRSATWPARRRRRSWSPATRPASSTRSRASPTTCRCW